MALNKIGTGNEDIQCKKNTGVDQKASFQGQDLQVQMKTPSRETKSYPGGFSEAACTQLFHKFTAPFIETEENKQLCVLERRDQYYHHCCVIYVILL